MSAQVGYGVGRPLVLRPFLAPGRGSLVVPDHAVAVMMMVMEQPVIEVVSVLMVVMPVVMMVFMARVRAPAFSPSVVVAGNKKHKSIETCTHYTPTDAGSLAESSGGGGGISVALKVETNNGILTVCLSGAVT